MPPSTHRLFSAFTSDLLDNSGNAVLWEAEVPTSQIFRDVQASKDTNGYLLSHGALTGLLENLSLRRLKIPRHVEIPANSTFLEEIQGRETFHQFSVFILLQALTRLFFQHFERNSSCLCSWAQCSASALSLQKISGWPNEQANHNHALWIRSTHNFMSACETLCSGLPCGGVNHSQLPLR